jgi:TPR repeat protein
LDEAEAVKWYLRAAEHGYAPAQSSVAVFYFSGIGGEKNYSEAYKWLVLPAKGGVVDNVKLMKELEKQLTPEQLEKAKEAARTWLAGPT